MLSYISAIIGGTYSAAVAVSYERVQSQLKQAVLESCQKKVNTAPWKQEQAPV